MPYGVNSNNYALLAAQSAVADGSSMSNHMRDLMQMMDPTQILQTLMQLILPFLAMMMSG